MSDKPLGYKAYGSIPHLPDSRMGPGDHHCEVGQARIATERVRDKHDKVWVQEKLDGSCVSVAKVDGEIIPLGRSGYRAVTSKYRQHILFHDWAMANRERFDALLSEGERAVGEWLAQAHGTRYDLTTRAPFVLFDIMAGTARVPYEELFIRSVDFALPFTLPGPLPVTAMMAELTRYGNGYYGALDPVEGAVWRVESRGVVDFLVKYVRPDKVDGSYLESQTGAEAVWNWQP